MPDSITLNIKYASLAQDLFLTLCHLICQILLVRSTYTKYNWLHCNLHLLSQIASLTTSILNKSKQICLFFWKPAFILDSVVEADREGLFSGTMFPGSSIAVKELLAALKQMLWSNSSHSQLTVYSWQKALLSSWTSACWARWESALFLQKTSTPADLILCFGFS